MSTKDIDTRIREKARKELKDRLQEAFAPAFRECQLGNATQTSLEHPNGEAWDRQEDGTHKKYLSATQCLEAAREALYERLIEKFEEQAVADFIRRVDSLQEQIDDLYEQVEN